MKYILPTALFLLCTTAILAQKPVIDTSVFDKWPAVSDPIISDDGNYVAYTITNRATIVIQAIHSHWQMEFSGTTKAITKNNKFVFIKKDTLEIVNLSDKAVEYIPHVNSFRLIEPDWLVYSDNNMKLTLRHLITGKTRSFAAVKNYQFNEDGDALLLETTNTFTFINLKNNITKNIWQGTNLNNFIIDKNGIAFIADHSLWHYKNDSLILLTDHFEGLQPDYVSAFSKDGKQIFFSLIEPPGPQPDKDAVKVDVWSYSDARLQSEQLKELGSRTYTAVINIKDHHIIRLTQEHEMIAPGTDIGTSQMIVVSRREGIFNEQCWNPVSRESCYIISTITGEKKRLNISAVMPSPTGKYLVGYDSLSHDMYSYNGKTQNLTGHLPIPDIDSTNDVPGTKYRGLQMAGWLERDDALLIYDPYDIWMIDPAGMKPPINITNGYGRKHNIVFRLSGMHFPFRKPVNRKEELIISAFNRITKENGFYSKRFSEKGDPVLLSMGPYLYDVPSELIMDGMAPLKAKKSNVYLVQRCSAMESPNYYYTTDFKTFNPITNIYPEKKYNWLTAELLSWKTADGTSVQGILYKPENFDPKKKYPVILHYYEKMSDYLYNYIPPAATDGLINIPWFVSHGYLVFTPDIYYTIEEPGQSACNAIVSASRYMSIFPFIDTSKIGLQGHSWSGYETNYTITHSHLFAAAVAGAGISDMISGYDAIIDQGGVSAQSYYESAQARIGVTLWQRPDLYIKNSPILQADKVTTPLLMMHNKADGLVPFAQGMEFFTALRRLNKKVWLLQYDDGGHHVYGKSAIDYTIRMTQFFDHYLRGLPAPEWMRKGVPARMKGL